MRFFLDMLGIVVADLRLKFRSDSWRFDGVIWIRTFASFSSSFSSCLFMRTGILTEQRAHRSSGCRCASQAAHTPARPSSWCQRAVVRRGTASGGVHLQPVCGGAQALARCPREGRLASRPASSGGRPSSNPRFFLFYIFKKIKFQKYMTVSINCKNNPLSPIWGATGTCRPSSGRQGPFCKIFYFQTDPWRGRDGRGGRSPVPRATGRKACT